MGPLTSFLLSQSAGSVNPLQSKLAENGLTPADVNRLAEDLVSEWQTDPELKARSLALIGKHPKDSVSRRDLEIMVRLLHATHSKNAGVLPEFMEKAKREGFIDPRTDDFSKNQAFGRAVGIGLLPTFAGAVLTPINPRIGVPLVASGLGVGALTYGHKLKKFRELQEKGLNPVTGKKHDPARIERTRQLVQRIRKNKEDRAAQDEINSQVFEDLGIKKAATTDYGVYSDERFHPQHVHNAANAVGMKWDNNPVFKRRCREWVGKEHLDAMTPAELGTVVGHVLRTTSLMAKHLTPAQIAKVTQQDPELHTLCEMELGELAIHGSLTKAKAHQLFGLTEKTAEVEYHGKTFPGYNKPIASDKKEKKMMVLAKKGDEVKLVHFGQKGYQHNYSPEAKQNYLTRSAGIRNKSGQLTKDDPFSPNYWARKVLWPKGETGHGHNGPVNTEVRMQRKEAGLFADETPLMQPGFMGNLTRATASLGLNSRAQQAQFEAARKSGALTRMGGLPRTAPPAPKVASAGLLASLIERKENEKWAAAAKLAEDNPLHHVAEIGGLGVLAAPYAADLLKKRPGMIGGAAKAYDAAFGHSAPKAMQHKAELVGLGTLAAPSAYSLGKWGVGKVKGPQQ
jgi:hypothetical protein